MWSVDAVGDSFPQRTQSDRTKSGRDLEASFSQFATEFPT
jgi:hypothetical protein